MNHFQKSVWFWKRLIWQFFPVYRFYTANA